MRRDPRAFSIIRRELTILPHRLLHHPVQPLLLLRERAPGALHAQEGELDVVVAGLFGQEGAVIGVVAIGVDEAHTG
jgi:hypothetical protein